MSLVKNWREINKFPQTSDRDHNEQLKDFSFMKIGNLLIDIPVFLAPMAGVTDYPFRVLCREQGAGVVYSEFVSAHGIIRENAKTWEMIKFTPEERPIGIQIFGDSPAVMARAAQMVAEKFQPDILDINYGCPVPKITKRGAGSAALRDLILMEEITTAVVEAVPELPVTVKMRAGWSQSMLVIPEAGPLLEKCGIQAITLHPRTTTDGYHNQADWNLIRILKETVTIPVIGNGDIRNVEDLQRMFATTGCDAVMVGRAALGNPWFFRAAGAVLKDEPKPPEPTIQARVDMCRRHFHLMLEWHGERVGTNLMRKHFGWYIKEFPGAATLRQQLTTAANHEEMFRLLDQIH